MECPKTFFQVLFLIVVNGTPWPLLYIPTKYTALLNLQALMLHAGITSVEAYGRGQETCGRVPEQNEAFSTVSAELDVRSEDGYKSTELAK